jgi:hypothetical protein
MQKHLGQKNDHMAVLTFLPPIFLLSAACLNRSGTASKYTPAVDMALAAGSTFHYRHMLTGAVI